MKRIFALLLCVALLIALPVGCKKNKKNEAAKADASALNAERIGKDLMNSNYLFPYAHIGDLTSAKDVKIVTKTTNENVTRLTVTATLSSSGAEIAAEVKLAYQVDGSQWKLLGAEAVSRTITLTGGPSLVSLQSTVTNYLQNNPTAQEQNKAVTLAAMGDGRHHLEVDLGALAWKVEYDAAAKTGKLNLSQETDALSFTGYYNLTFNEQDGWVIESEKQDDGRYYLLLHVNGSEQN